MQLINSIIRVYFEKPGYSIAPNTYLKSSYSVKRKQMLKEIKETEEALMWISKIKGEKTG